MINTIHQMDCQEGMQLMEPDSVDLIVTDPPYGYKFMGKDWDRAVPHVEVWEECLRVLKPGAFLMCMSAPRQDVLSHMIVNLGDAGFETGFTSIYWTYASGFPKASNISKMVDKRLGEPNLSQAFNTAGRGERKDLQDAKQTLKFREDYGYKHKLKNKEAQELDGCFGGFQPKPAVEVILIAMKPLSEKTYVDQALMNGHGVTWLDDVRIPYQSTNDKPSEGNRGSPIAQQTTDNSITGWNRTDYDGKFIPSSGGRFPANLLASDDVLNDGRIQPTTYRPNDKQFKPRVGQNIYGKYNYRPPTSNGDGGSFSRYFSLDAWWQTNIQSLPESVLKTFPFLLVPKASKSEKNRGCETLPPKFSPTMNDGIGMVEHNPETAKPKNNSHPTVKPLKLMTYLITLGSRPGDLVLDPYAGSGTTLIAAKLLNRNYVGFELEPEYKSIADHRLQAYNPEPESITLMDYAK